MADLKFAIWESWIEIFDQMTDESLANLVRGMCAYAFKAEEPEFKPGSPESFVWPAVKTSVKKSAEISKRNHENGSKHVGKATEKPMGEPNEKPKRKPTEKPNEKPNEKPSSQSGKPNGKPEKNRKGKEVEGELNSSLEEKNSIPPVATDGAAMAKASPPSAPVCPKCGSGCIGTNSSKPGRNGTRQYLYHCPDCFEDVWVDGAWT